MINKVKIGIIQNKISDNFKKNLISAIKNIKKAASKKAKIICIPELCLSNYFCQTEIKIKCKEEGFFNRNSV